MVLLAVVTAAVSLLVGRAIADDAVRSLVRAPAGCDTAIRFDRAATVDVWIETRGTLAEVPGSCAAASPYDHGSAAVPQVLVTVVDVDDGATLRLQRTTTEGYDRAGFRGSRFRTLDVTAGRSVVVRVEAPAADQIVVAFGPDPSGAGRPVTVGGVAAAVALLVVGIGVLIGGIVRRFAGFTDVTDPDRSRQPYVPPRPHPPRSDPSDGPRAHSPAASSPPTWSPPPPPGSPLPAPPADLPSPPRPEPPADG